jgi:hypothetical protein
MMAPLVPIRNDAGDSDPNMNEALRRVRLAREQKKGGGER